MNTLAEEFKKHLDSISPEQFKKEWDEIESLGLCGPTVEEYMLNLKLNNLAIKFNKLKRHISRKRKLIYLYKMYKTR